MKRFAILVAATAALTLASGPAFAEGTPTGPFPACQPGQVPTREAPCKLPPCAEGQLPTPQAPCALNKPLPPCAEGQLPSAQAPCLLPLCPADTQPTLDRPCRVEGQGLFPQIGDGPKPPADGDEQGDDQGETGKPSGDRPSGDKHPGFGRGFLSRVWRFNAESDYYDAAANVLNVTITEITNLPKKFAGKGDEIVDQDAYVVFSKTTKVFDGDGKRVKSEDGYDALLDDADAVKVVGKLMPPAKWQQDEDGVPVTTIRAKRVVVVS